MKYNKIWAFLLVSITIHVIGISLAQDKSNFFVKPGGAMNVRLVTSKNDSQNTSVSTIEKLKKVTPYKQKKSVIHDQNDQIKTIKAPTPASPTFEIATINKPLVEKVNKYIPSNPPPSESTDDTHTQDELETNKNMALQYLQNKLSKHFNYPRMAVNKGWQGKVLLGFQLKRNGIIENIYIAKSSGYAILDRAASKALANIQSIPQTNTWFNYTSSDLQLPVIYKLQEG